MTTSRQDLRSMNAASLWVYLGEWVLGVLEGWGQQGDTNVKTEEAIFITGAKAIAYAVLLVAAAVTLVRGVIGPLWGADNDLGVFAAVGVGTVGVLGLAWLALILFRDAAKTYRNKGENSDEA